MISRQLEDRNYGIMTALVQMLVIMIRMFWMSFRSSENYRIFMMIVSSGSFRKWMWYWKSADMLARVVDAAMSTLWSFYSSLESSTWISNFRFIWDRFWWKFWAQDRLDKAITQYIRVVLS